MPGGDVLMLHVSVAASYTAAQPFSLTLHRRCHHPHHLCCLPLSFQVSPWEIEADPEEERRLAEEKRREEEAVARAARAAARLAEEGSAAAAAAGQSSLDDGEGQGGDGLGSRRSETQSRLNAAEAAAAAVAQQRARVALTGANGIRIVLPTPRPPGVLDVGVAQQGANGMMSQLGSQQPSPSSTQQVTPGEEVPLPTPITKVKQQAMLDELIPIACMRVVYVYAAPPHN